MYKHLLVPVDGSELSQHAVQAALALAKPLGAQVSGLVCESLPVLPAVGMHPSNYQLAADQHRAYTDAHAEKVLGEFEAAAREAGVAFQGLQLRSDDVDQAIVDAAREQGCDLIVMATHGRSRLGEWLFGSHTKAVLAKSRLPVLVIH
jgi:nucleotide-binding universal stress UspA family protein